MDQNNSPGGSSEQTGAETPIGVQPTQPVEPYSAPPSYNPPPPQSQGGYAPPPGGPVAGQETPQGYPPPPGAYPQQGGYQPQPGYQQPSYPQQPGYGPQSGYPQQPQSYGPPPPGYPQPQVNYAVPVKKSGVPAWVWIIGVVVLLLIGICVVLPIVLVSLGGQAIKSAANSIVPIGVSSEFYSYMSANQYDAARNLLSSDMKNKYSVDDLRTRWQALESSAGTITPGLPSVSQSDDTSATLTQPFTTVSSNGKTYQVRLTMKNTGSQNWVITGADPDLIPNP